jgi:YD repeat-containing protein
MLMKDSRLKPISLFLVVSTSIVALGFALAFRWTQVNFSGERSGANSSTPDGNRERDGLVGPVHRVLTERAKLLVKSGALVEGSRELFAATTYDLQGNRIDSSYFLVTGDSHAGKEEYKYDGKGNIVETTVRDDNDSVLSREVYKYEFDSVGNWTKMNTFLLVYDGGKLSYEPTEVTYRNITYYYNQTVADINNPTSKQPSTSNERLASATVAESESSQQIKDKEQASSSLRSALEEWIAATNARDIEKQMSFYAPVLTAYYRTRSVSREFVSSDKTRVFQQAELIDIRAGTPEIKIEPDGRAATMRFFKQYEIRGGGQDRRGEVVQELRWQLINGRWLIISERDVRVMRRQTRA